MTLHEYLKGLGKEGLDDFARRCGTTIGQLRQVSYNNRRAGAALAVSIERESKGSVTCDQLRPDIDWHYLRHSLAA